MTEKSQFYEEDRHVAKAIRPKFEEILFDKSIAGQTLLDIGSYGGDLCIEAMRRGAASALGIDVSLYAVRAARRRVVSLEHKPKFVEADFEEWSTRPKSYDVVTCFDTLHHLYDPIGAIRKMMTIARDRILFDYVPLTASELEAAHHSAPIRVWPDGDLMATLPDKTLAPCERTLMFTRKAIQILMNSHSGAYERIQIHPSGKDSRLIVEAKRRHIEHLILVAGPTSVGKSTFLERLRSPELSARFGIEADVKDAPTVLANNTNTLGTGTHRSVIFHYDILRPFGRTSCSYQRDPPFHLLSCADRITLITLANTPAEIRHRITSRESPFERQGPAAVNRPERVAALYKKADFLLTWYQSWFTAVSRHMKRDWDRSFMVLTDEAYSDIPDIDTLNGLLRQV